MSNMQSRVIASPKMQNRVSSFAGDKHYIYNESNVMYNQPLVIYNYSTNKGNMSTRTIAGPIMRGR